MKFRHYLETISGIEIYPLLSMFVFLAFFTLLIVYVIKAKKKDIEELENIPLK
ncbi:MAG: CcoQ/FixQ family Cbb3-type cytochrome c oxidase assembly chaperone [Saprospiraceae bacterium]